MPKQNTKPADYPQAVIQQIALLAQNIVVARRRRKETQAQWAKRLGVSQPTMARIERGDPSVGMASYVMCMWLIQPDCSLADLIAPQHDTIALEREIAKVQPRRTPAGSNSRQNLRVHPADKRRESSSDTSVASKAAGPYTTAQIKKISDHYSAATSLADAAKNLGYSSAAELARSMDSHSTQTAVGLAALIAKAQSSR